MSVTHEPEAVPPGSRPSSLDDRRFIGHPGGLAWMFQVEFWERFSYYGMRAILLYFIVDTIANGGLGIAQNTGEAILATYGAAVYLLAIPGGYVADRILGPWHCVFWGGIVIMAGHICLAVPATATAWVGICLVAVGTGFIKPNLSTMVGALYDRDDPRRDAGFQIFYMSINIGAFLSPLLVAWLKNTWGYHAGFAAAAVGMALALVAFVGGRRTLKGIGAQVPNPMNAAEKKRLGIYLVGILIGAYVLFLIFNLIEGNAPAAIIDTVSAISIGSAVAYFLIMFRSPKVNDVERSHLWAYIPLWMGGALFFMIFEQAAGKMATFADKNTDLTVGSFMIPPEWYQSINPAAIVLLAPLLGWYFTRRAGRFPQTAMKFSLAVFLVGLSALLMGWGFQTWPGGSALAPFWFLGAVFVLQTVAELFISPVGLSATTMLAPRAFASQAMALWLLTSAAGQGVAALLIKAMSDFTDATYYYALGGITLVVAVVLLLLVPWTQNKMADIEDMRREAADAARTLRADRSRKRS
ncbi:peptide MFS transporter [Gephyromycinifex aptenodytis]|uniref:peptide MFS transporter n=1 Tax=Gephyromycinifex aptenodytis TaxID=2716227 RepID=UPI001D03447C|nr:oligopeptide:H+ symporter [Gephyromycinifex aptenodytis]